MICTFNGAGWVPVSAPGFGSRLNTSGRSIAAFKGYLYIGVENRWQGGSVWRHAIEDDGALTPGEKWHRTSDDMANERNTMYTEFQVYDDGNDEYLYVGSMNRRNGHQLWRTLDGELWQSIYKGGNGISTDWAVMTMHVFDNLLYIGTMNFEEGTSLLVSTDLNATEFTPIFTKGNGSSENIYIWSMMDYENKLYMSTMKNTRDGAFDFFSISDSATNELTIETNSGFGSPYGGIRSMAIHDGKLMMGTADINPVSIFEAESRNMNATDL